MNDGFAGDEKKGQSVLGPHARRFINWTIPKIPKPVLSQQLTMLTLLWAIWTVLFGWLADDNRVWLHGMSAMVFLQWPADIVRVCATALR